MAHRYEGYLKLLLIDHHFLCFGPIKLLYYATLGKDVFGIQASEEDGCEPVLERVEGMRVQVVVVVVADEDSVDGWKL